MKLLDGEMYFSKKEVAQLVGRSALTIHNYDVWSREREEKGIDRFIPKPIIIDGVRFWSNTDVEKIKEFLKWIEEHRGAMVEYSKRYWSKK